MRIKDDRNGSGHAVRSDGKEGCKGDRSMSIIPVIIPSYEPDDRLLVLLNELEREHIGPVYIVDDGSGEEYSELFELADDIVRRSGGRILVHEQNRGKGRALKTAFHYILKHVPEAIAAVTADSDGQHTPACIQKIRNAAEKNGDALILGVRRFDVEGVPWKSRFGNRMTEKVFSYIAGVHISDTQTGLRGLPRKFMEEIKELKGERFEYEMRMLLEAAGSIRIVEVPVETVYDSKEDHQTHFHPFRDSLKVYRILGEKFLKYCFSSVSSCLVDLILFFLLCRALKNYYPVLYIAAATAAARIVSASYNYWLNYKVVFKSREKIPRSAVKYVILAVLQMSCSALLTTAFVLLFPGIPEFPVKIVADTFLFFLSYFIQQKIVFRR